MQQYRGVEQEGLGVQAVLLLLLGALIVYINRFTHLDFTVADWFYSSSQHAFPLQHQWWAEQLLHNRLKHFSTVLWFGLLAWVLVQRFVRKAGWSHQALFVLISSMVSAAVVSLLKTKSMHSCPWDLQAYGGQSTWLPLFYDASSVDLSQAGSGKCFPSGHASVGLMWLGVFFLPRIRRALAWPAGRHQRALSVAVLSLSLVVGLVQLVRGAHFLSHVLATLWLCWLISLLVSALYIRLFVVYSRPYCYSSQSNSKNKMGEFACQPLSEPKDHPSLP
ncbi:MAG TPA: phosphatase PAP2 family protein [Limnobacter sp.]|uniref:phosphatase PAP2 family protein n=1 Tax=Limnobacter sp. TaxID=2003368 RepID=UPI002ED83AB3